MNHNQPASVKATLSFDFRGETFKPSIFIDLHHIMLNKQGFNHLHDLLATSIGLDSYRHEYDILVMEDIVFSEPTGLAYGFVEAGKLNFDAFISAWQQQQVLAIIQPIAQRHLNISDLSQHSDIQHALIASYLAGQKNTPTKKPDHSDSL